MRWKKPRAESSEYGVSVVDLLSEVEKFLRSTYVAPARFGREVMGDPRFVFDLRNGREPRERTVTRVRTILKEAIN